MNSPNICMILAAYNEEEGIGPTISEMKEVLNNFSFIMVDGDSKDNTLQIAKDMGGDVFIQSGTGKGNAISQALLRIKGEPDYIVFTDADFTYPAKHINEMISWLETDPEIGMVLGNRFNKRLKPLSMKNPYYAGNRLLAIAQLLLNGVKLNDPLTGLRVVRWEVLKGWKPKSKGFDIEAELNHHIERSGYKIMEIPISYRIRLGKKKLGLKHGFSIFKRIVSESIYSRRFIV